MHTLRYENLVFHRMHSAPESVWRRRLLCDRPQPDRTHLWLGTHRARGVYTWCICAFGPQKLNFEHISQSGRLHANFDDLEGPTFFDKHWNPKELYNEGTLAKLYIIFGPPPTVAPDGWSHAG